jgi:ABC-type bacteriocin/lantibiotic exporter with double-glycine peptidase domain
VQEALDRVMTNRTTVIVAHRLSTVRNADTIAVIHQGTLVEKGKIPKRLISMIKIIHFMSSQLPIASFLKHLTFLVRSTP